MATVRKRKLPSGLVRWQASYTDGAGLRACEEIISISDTNCDSLEQWAATVFDGS
jgi:hypothetical protein